MLAFLQAPTPTNAITFEVGSNMILHLHLHLLFEILLATLLWPSEIHAQISTVTEAPSVPTNPPQFTDDSTFQDAILNSTNVFRAQHNASSVVWNATLAHFGQVWSDGCIFKHTVSVLALSHPQIC